MGSTSSLLALCQAHAVDSLDLAASAGSALASLNRSVPMPPVSSGAADGEARQLRTQASEGSWVRQLPESLPSQQQQQQQQQQPQQQQQQQQFLLQQQSSADTQPTTSGSGISFEQAAEAAGVLRAPPSSSSSSSSFPAPSGLTAGPAAHVADAALGPKGMGGSSSAAAPTSSGRTTSQQHAAAQRARAPNCDLAESLRVAAAAAVGAAALGVAAVRDAGAIPSGPAAASSAAAPPAGASKCQPPAPLQRLPSLGSGSSSGGSDAVSAPLFEASSPKLPPQDAGPRVRRRASRLNAGASGGNPSRLSHNSAVHAQLPGGGAATTASGSSLSASFSAPMPTLAALALAGGGGFGAAGAAERDPPLMPSLPQVDFIERIGKGSFGEVFKGVWNDSVVAVKVIQVYSPRHHPQRRSAPSGGGSSSASVGAELARHEYESWLNANLRHPHIVQLFTSFTVAVEGPPAARGAGAGAVVVGGGGSGGGGAGGKPAAAAGGVWEGSLGGGAGATCWKTHLIMEWCDMGTMQVKK